jgi:hypothetical protein
MKKHSLATVSVVAVAATTASASVSIGYVAEQSGNTWSLGNDTYVGLMGFKQTAQGQTITAADILGDISAPSRVIELGNGVGNLGSSLNTSGGVGAYESTTFFGSQFDFLTGDKLPFSNDIDVFTGVDLTTDGFGSGRYVSVVFVFFTGSSNLVFTGDVGGSATLSANGSLGAFPAQLVPAPGAAMLAGLAGLTAVRRRRG